MQSFTDLSSPPVLADRPKRTTAGYGAENVVKPDTGYSLSRAGTREVFEEKTGMDKQPIGRLRGAPGGPAYPQTQPLPRQDIRPPGRQRRLLFTAYLTHPMPRAAKPQPQ